MTLASNSSRPPTVSGVAAAAAKITDSLGEQANSLAKQTNSFSYSLLIKRWVSLLSPLGEAQSTGRRGHLDHQRHLNVRLGAQDLGLVHNLLLQQLEAHLDVQAHRARR